MVEISEEVVERMIALIRELHADHVKHGSIDIVQDFVARTAAIVAELPEPVDPDLIVAREIAAANAAKHYGNDQHSRVLETLAGDLDDNLASGVPLALEALKRGRELALSTSNGEAK